MKLEDRVLRLIAVGASIAASCQPCLRKNVVKARENGADEQEIAEAIWVGTIVKSASASHKGKIAAEVDEKIPLIVSSFLEGCVCGEDDSGREIPQGDDHGISERKKQTIRV